MALDDQLELSLKISQATERTSQTLERITQTLETQVDVLTRLSQVFDRIDLNKTVRDLNDFSKAAGDSSKQAKSVTEQVEEAAAEMLKFNKRTNDSSKLLKGSFAKSAIIATTAAVGFHHGIKSIVAMSKGITGFVTGFASSAVQLGAAIASIPFKILTGLIDFAAKADSGMSELLEAIENLRKEFGDLKGPGAGAVLETTKTLKGFSDTGLSAYRVFGTVAETLRRVTEVAVAMGPAFGKLQKEFRDNGGALLGFQKGLGVADDQMKALGNRAITSGESLSKLLLDVSKQTLQLGKAFEIDQKLIGKDLAKASEDVRHFGQSTVKEIARASVYARKLGVELERVTGILDAFETFDTAAENSAKLSQSFGVTVDAFKLMEAQSPDEQIEMLRKQFALANVDASKFNRQQLKLLETTTGLDAATAKQVFSMQNQGVSLDDIKKKSDSAAKKQLTQAEAMSKLADSIERMVKSGATQHGGFFDQFINGFLRGIQSSQEFRQMIYSIKRALNVTMLEGVKLGREFVKIFPGVKDFFGGFRDFFEPQRFKKLFGDVRKTFVDFFQDLASGRFSFKKLMEDLREHFFDFFDTSTPGGQRVLGGFTKFTRAIARVVGQAIPWIAEQLGKGLQTIADFIRDPSKFGNQLKGSADQATGFVGQIVAPIAEGLKKAWEDPKLRQGLSSFVLSVSELLQKLFKSPVFKKAAAGALTAMAGTLFSSALLQGVLGGLTAKVAGAAAKLFKGGLFGKGAQGIAQASVGKGASKLLSVAGPIGALAAAAASIGSGVKTYTSKITSTLDQSSKVIGAGATGVINALTLGLLPSDLTVQLANTFASVSDGVFKAMSQSFGQGFADTVKRKLSSTFELFGGVYDFVAQLFTGDQASFEKSASELGLSLLRFLASSFETVVFQLPIMVGKLTAQVLGLVAQMTTKSTTLVLGLIAKGVDKVFGTDLQAKVTAASEAMQRDLRAASDKIAKGMESASDALSKKSGELTDKYLRTAEDQSKIAREAADKAASARTAAVVKANVGAEKSLSEALTNVRAAKELQKELSGGIDVKKMIEDVKQKTSGIDFSQLSGLTSGLDVLLESTTKLQDVQDRIASISDVFSSIGELPKSIKSAMGIVKAEAFKPAVEAVHKMVELANELDTALSDGNLNKLDVKAKLQNVANGVGLGSKGKYTIQNKAVNITLNLQVSINAEDLEKALVMRTKSVIRERLNWVANNPGDKGGPDIPFSTSSPIAPIGKV